MIILASLINAAYSKNTGWYLHYSEESSAIATESRLLTFKSYSRKWQLEKPHLPQTPQPLIKTADVSRASSTAACKSCQLCCCSPGMSALAFQCHQNIRLRAKEVRIAGQTPIPQCRFSSLRCHRALCGAHSKETEWCQFKKAKHSWQNSTKWNEMGESWGVRNQSVQQQCSGVPSNSARTHAEHSGSEDNVRLRE